MDKRDRALKLQGQLELLERMRAERSEKRSRDFYLLNLLLRYVDEVGKELHDLLDSEKS